jgi:mono/diheme cytochrome c family protein
MRKLAASVLCPLAALLALVPAPADAGCRRVAVVQPAVVVQHQAVVATPIVATTFLQVPVPVYPVFGVGYGPSDAAAEIRALTAELARIRQQLSAPLAPAKPRVEAPAPAAPMPKEETQAPADPKLSLALASCVRCHSGPAAKGAIALASTDGSPLPALPLVTRLRAFRAVATGKMPPNGPAVSDEALDALAAWSAAD